MAADTDFPFNPAHPSRGEKFTDIPWPALRKLTPEEFARLATFVTFQTIEAGAEFQGPSTQPAGISS